MVFEGRGREHPRQSWHLADGGQLCSAPWGTAKPSELSQLAPLASAQWSDDATYISGLVDISLHCFPRGKVLSLVSPGFSALGQEWRTQG